MIAITHPGKIGDLLYALPIAKWLCEQQGCQADFYTSEVGRPALRLLERQSCIRHARIAPGYQIHGNGPGIQPWEMPVPPGYDHVYHLGFRGPFRVFIRDYVAGLVGAPNGLPLDFEHDPVSVALPSEYIVVAPRGQTTFREAFGGLVAQSPLPVVQVGAAGEAVPGGLDYTGLDLLETLPILKWAQAFYGLMSSNLVLANACPELVRIAPHDGIHWDMSHVVQSHLNHYPINPSAETLLSYIRPLSSYCRTFGHNDYYELCRDTAVLDAVRSQLGAGNFQFNHPHRRWEYGLVLQALRHRGARTVLDVGGGGSPFASACARRGAAVHQLDPCDFTALVAEQNRRSGTQVRFTATDLLQWSAEEQFDAVACISVIEHVPDHAAFFQKLLHHVAPGGLLALTTDSHASGQPQCGSHLRTYNATSLTAMAQVAATQGFRPYGGPLDWRDNGYPVNGYTFASLVLERA